MTGQPNIPTSTISPTTNYLNKPSSYYVMGPNTTETNPLKLIPTTNQINSQKTGPVRATYEAIVERPKSANTYITNIIKF